MSPCIAFFEGCSLPTLQGPLQYTCVVMRCFVSCLHGDGLSVLCCAWILVSTLYCSVTQL